MTHGARALQPNGFRFRLIPRKVPGLSAHWLRRREGGGGGAGGGVGVGGPGISGFSGGGVGAGEGGSGDGDASSGSATAGVGSGAGDGKRKKKHRKGRSSGKAPRGSDGQAGALGRDQLRDSRTRDTKH